MSTELPLIEVTFIDDKTGEPFAKTTCAAGALPESFASKTTLHIGSDDWSVISATPLTREEYVRSRLLTLRVRKIEWVDPGKILFSLPSIFNALAPLSTLTLVGDELILHEDDWRQVEFVSNSFQDEIEEEIASIRRVHQDEWANPGWRNMHVRTRPTRPIVSRLTLSGLAKSNNVARVREVSYRDAESPIADGYSFSVCDGLFLYGTAPGDVIEVLAVAPMAKEPPSRDVVERLAQVAQDFDLCLVNWCRCVRAQPSEQWFGAILAGEDAEEE
ncbi:MAG: hypothetical protein K8T25_21345 [Planctomycetia bacterium]|nr:hypothetical protein [Planctomycetia bacterium]